MNTRQLQRRKNQVERQLGSGWRKKTRRKTESAVLPCTDESSASCRGKHTGKVTKNDNHKEGRKGAGNGAPSREEKKELRGRAPR